MNMLQDQRRMFVMLTEPAKHQPFQYGHGGSCRQGFFCGFHPISKCADVEVWKGSEMRPMAEKDGFFFGHYGKKKTFDLAAIGKSNDDRIDIGSVWMEHEPKVTGKEENAFLFKLRLFRFFFFVGWSLHVGSLGSSSVSDCRKRQRME